MRRNILWDSLENIVIIERGRGWEFLLLVEWGIGMVKDGLDRLGSILGIDGAIKVEGVYIPGLIVIYVDTDFGV
jgi:hypothetical protein